MRLSQALEDYIKAIYVLETEGDKATTNRIAEYLNVSSYLHLYSNDIKYSWKFQIRFSANS